MAMYRKQSGTNVAATPKRRSGSTWVTPSALRRRLGTTWVDAWSGLSVTASNVYNSIFLPEPAPLTQRTTNYASPVVTGSSSYTASWVRVSGDTSILCSNTSILNPAFTCTLYKNTEVTAVWRLTVTSSGRTASVDVPFYLSYWTDL